MNVICTEKDILYSFGGKNSQGKGVKYVYKIYKEDGTWKKKEICHMIQPRYAASLLLSLDKSKIYIIGGLKTKDKTTRQWEYEYLGV